MPRRTQSTPRVTRKAGPTDRAVLRLNGKIFYLGSWDDPAAHQRGEMIVGLYFRWGRPAKFNAVQLEEIEAVRTDSATPPPPASTAPPAPAQPATQQFVLPNGQPLTPEVLAALMGQQAAPVQLTVQQAMDRYLDECEIKYAKPNQRQLLSHYRRMCGRFAELFGNEPINSMRASHLDRFRKSLMSTARSQNGRKRTLTAQYLNEACGKVKTACRWLFGQELISHAAMDSVCMLPNLKPGEYGAKKSRIVKDVELDAIKATLPFISPVPRDMVILQLLTGARPGELFKLRPCDLRENIETGHLEYEPEEHKTAHHGEERHIVFAEQAQEVLAGYLDRPAKSFCFSPDENYELVRAARKAARKTPMTPSQRARAEAFALRRKPRANQYNRNTYRRAIERAIKAANKDRTKEELIPHWYPYRLRHTAATIAELGVGQSKVSEALGHTNLKTTRVYTHNRKEKVREVANYLDQMIDLSEGGAV